jgi:hypothetical protein
VRFHEALCFLHAYPDDPEVFRRVGALLAAFGTRSDVRRHAEALRDSGIAGTATHYPFSWVTSRWLVERCPDRVVVDWPNYEDTAHLDELLPLLVPFGETLALDEADLTTEEWVNVLKAPQETDAAFLIRRMEHVGRDERERETLYESLGMPLRIESGPDAPARSGARWGRRAPRCQRKPLRRSRPDVRETCRKPPVAVRPVSARRGRELIDLTREAMVTRSRDLYAFKSADANDVRIVDCGDGLQFAAIGQRPDRRLMLDCVYGFLTLKNDVPIGYVLSSSYFNSTEVAYNVFDTFRGGEAGYVYGRVLSMMHHLFGANAFTVDPYQLGHENDEGLESGAWWFYYKLGFRPVDPATKRLVRREVARVESDPRRRTGIEMLNRMSAEPMFFFLGKPRRDVRGIIPLDNIGLAVTRYVAERFGSDRETATRTCAAEAARLLGIRSRRGWSEGERLAWDRWSPLMLALPGVRRWPAVDRRALAEVARAKGARRESDFVTLFNAHARLRRALLALAARTS